MAQIKINVYTPALDLVGIIEDYESASITRSFYEAGQWSVTINKNLPNADLLQKGYYVQFGSDPRDAGKITTVQQNIDEGGKGSQKLVVSGLDLRAMFSQRSVMQINDVDQFYLSDDAETVIKTLISDQCGATCTNSNRVFPNLAVAANQGRGETYTVSAKYTDLYAECATAAIQSLVGWYVSIDHVNKTFIMDCEIGLDRSAAQSVNPLCLFSPDMDSLKSASFVDDVSTFRNLVYVGGDGRGAARVIHTGYDTTEPTGFNRYEMFRDASNVSTPAALNAEAQALLKQYNQTYELDGDVLALSPYVYKEQYNVGDICTVKFGDVNLNVRILDITQSWSWGEYSITSTWGKSINTLSGQISALSTGASRKSSGSEVGTNVSGMKNGVMSYDLSSADHTMDGSECFYNVLEIIGALTANRTFTFYRDSARGYGTKKYTLLICAIANTGTRTITFTTGVGSDLVVEINATHANELYEIFVLSNGNVIGNLQTVKSTIADADEVGGNNSEDSFKWVKWTWTTVKKNFDPRYMSDAYLSPLLCMSLGLPFNKSVTPIAVGTYPYGVAFDGTNIWVANYGSNNVSKINVSTNTVAATVSVGAAPHGVAFDGTNIWVTNYNSGNVSKINVSTNTVAATVSVGTAPVGVAFDGTNIWVANYSSNNVSKINVSTNTVTATVSVGASPIGVAFDGTNIWVANYSSNNVSKINAKTNGVFA